VKSFFNFCGGGDLIANGDTITDTNSPTDIDEVK